MLEHGWQGECFSEDEEEDGEGWIKSFTLPIFVFFFVGFLVFILIFCFLFCSSLRKKLPLMRRCKESKTNAKRKMPGDDDVGDHPF